MKGSWCEIWIWWYFLPCRTFKFGFFYFSCHLSNTMNKILVTKYMWNKRVYAVRLDCMLSCDNLIDLSSKRNYFSCYCFAICVFCFCRCRCSSFKFQYRFPYAFKCHKQILDSNWKVKIIWVLFVSFHIILMWPVKMHRFQTHHRVFALWKHVFHLDVMLSTTFCACVCACVRCHACTFIFIYTFIIKIESLE